MINVENMVIWLVSISNLAELVETALMELDEGFFVLDNLSISLGFSDNTTVKSKSYLNMWKNTPWNSHIQKLIAILHANLEGSLPGESTLSPTLVFQTMIMNPAWIFMSNIKRRLFSNFFFLQV